MRCRLPRLTLVIAALLSAALLHAVPAETSGEKKGEPFTLVARSAILIDQASGRVLYQRNADQPFVPASLAKLMSLHIIYEKLADRSISRTDVVSLSTHAWANNQAPGSTLMNLGPGQIVTVEELMKGMAVASGNDAATALAEYVAGSTTNFVRLMNEEAKFLGYATTRFTDPAGVQEANRVTAREFADFCRRYIDQHPEALAELHSLREFEYPLAQNLVDGRRTPHVTKKQYNGNYLVWDDFGVDGLKTGHLDDENFTAAITARRGDMRLIVVLLGVQGPHAHGGGAQPLGGQHGPSLLRVQELHDRRAGCASPGPRARVEGRFAGGGHGAGRGRAHHGQKERAGKPRVQGRAFRARGRPGSEGPGDRRPGVFLGGGGGGQDSPRGQH